MHKSIAQIDYARLKLFASVAAFGLLLSCMPLSAQTQDKAKPDATTPDGSKQAPFKLQSRSNLVVVRVIVRDSQGKPVEGLKKEDFRLFDRGKEQSIAQFEVESSKVVTSAVGQNQTAAANAAAMPGKFLALYFDDLNTSDADMIQAREAADRYLATNLHPKDRVAIFTSAKALTDFTADPKQIHDALAKLHPSARGSHMRECPDISDYQALQISQFEDDPNSDAMKVALDEGAHCFPPVAGEDIKMLARRILSEAQILARANLQAIERTVAYVAHMPGQRNLILVSPGFMSQSEQYQLDRIIDSALRAQVVISSLDPKGLALLMRESNVQTTYIPTANSGVISAARSIDSSRESVATDVLAEVAQGTGGEFFHNNNDLKAGFDALGGSPIYYTLAFSPTDAKNDGKFHALKVTLAQKQKGISIQARRGYFTPKNEAQAAADAKQQAISDAEAQSQEQIREAILAKTDTQQFPVIMSAKLSPTSGEARELSLMAHLDAQSLHFHKDGEHNVNSIIFIFAIFDQKENLVTSQQRQARVSVLDGQLPGLAKTGVDASMTFQLKPGVYRVREVVTDSEEHRMTTFSRMIKIP